MATNERMIGHMVYFTLKEPTPANRRALVAACYEHLKGHPGEMYFAAGVVGDEFDRPVNDRAWDVALHVVFRTKADHDHYQNESERHRRFLAACKETWAQVRVFDSLIDAT